MKKRLYFPLLIAVLVLVMSTVAAACNSGGGELTLEEYFQKLEALSTKYNAEGDALGSKFDEEFGSEEEESVSEEEQIEAFRDFFVEGISLLGDFVGGIDNLNPPAEVKAAHEESVDAGRNAVDVFQEFVNRLNDVGSSAELDEEFDDPGIAEAGDRFSQSCLTLQGIADDNAIDVNLDCEDVE